MPKLAVLVSGQGSLLTAFVSSGLCIDLVLADRRCNALEYARDQGLPTTLIERHDFTRRFDRSAYSKLVVNELLDRDIDVVAMAGWKTILTESFLEVYAGRALNIHPSLLPRFPGNDAVRQALEAQEEVTGCTVHVVTATVDAGQILGQQRVRIMKNDRVGTLHERIKRVERDLYPVVIRDFMAKVGPRN